MVRIVMDLLFSPKPPKIDQYDIFIFWTVVLWETFDSSLQIHGTDSPNHENCHIFLPDFFISHKPVKNRFFFEDDFEV